MSKLQHHAERELRLAGFFDKNSDYGGMLGDAVMELVSAFAAQEHSGMSAPLVIRLFSQVASYKLLAPLTGEDHEWERVDNNLWQNNRLSSVFKDATGYAYDIDGRTFLDGEARYTSVHSRVPVTFPYVQEIQHLDCTAEEWVASQ